MWIMYVVFTSYKIVLTINKVFVCIVLLFRNQCKFHKKDIFLNKISKGTSSSLYSNCNIE